jgi:hypothetical protein
MASMLYTSRGPVPRTSAPILGFSLLVAFLAASCVSGGGGGAIEGSRVREYHSIQQLASDSDRIVIAVATSTRTEDSVQAVPYTVTVANVQSVLKGSPVSAVKVRQFGNSSVSTSDDFDALLTAGTTYVLFLDVFTYGPGQDTDQHVVVGGSAGEYRLDGDTLHHVRGPDPIPETLSLKDLRAAIAAA